MTFFHNLVLNDIKSPYIHLNMRVTFVLLFLFISTGTPYAQTITTISDGSYGFYRNIENDTVTITGFEAASQARSTGLAKGDKIISVNGKKVSGEGLSSPDYQILFSSPSGSDITLQVFRKGVDSLITFKLKPGFEAKSWSDCFYDYANVTSDEVPQQSEFMSMAETGTRVFSISREGSEEIPDIRPGDEFLSFRQGYFSWTKLMFSEYHDNDTIIRIRRDSSVLNLHEDLRKYKDIRIKSVLSHDLEAESIWLRIILVKNMREDRSYLLRFMESYDTILLFRRSDDGRFQVSRSGSGIAGEYRNLYYKSSPIIRLNIRKEGTDTLYARLYRTGGIIYPPEIDFLTLDYVNDFEKTERLILGSLLGMMTIIALYFLIIYFFLKDRSFLFFMLFILSLGFTLLHLSGYGPQFVWPGSLKFFNRIEILFLVLPFTFFAIFSSIYLDLSSAFRKWERTGRIILTTALIATSLILIDAFRNKTDAVSNFNYIFLQYIFLCVIALGLMIIIAAILRTRQSYRPARGFLVGIIIILISVVVYFENNNLTGFLNSSFNLSVDISAMFLHASMYIGSIILFLVFSVSLGQKMRNTNIEMSRAQQKIIDQLKENEILKNRVNLELEQKVKERTFELEKQRNILQQQKQEITDSINYAKYIQSALLPLDEVLESYFRDYFVFFRPRDIVSGDFYWATVVENITVVAVVDCTGHGVPGAFMSMLGSAFLNEVVNKEYITHPAVILRRLRKEVIRALHQRGERGEQKDGMDLALCSIDYDNLKLQFAGANNPLYLVREAKLPEPPHDRKIPGENFNLYELKGDRMPVGYHDTMGNFTLRETDLIQGDVIYLFTDGYADQFGGPEQKKLQYRNFKKLLLDICHYPMKEQGDHLDKTLLMWKGELEQIDDILVVGIRI